MQMRLGFWKRAFALVLPVVLSGQAGAVDLDLARFATAKQAQVREYAKDVNNKVPSTVWSLFDAVRVDDWETATNLAARLEKASGRYADSATDEAMSPALRTVIWPPISEMIGAFDEFHNWDNKWLHRFGREILDSIPRGSVYFGGTDAGRFIISALSDSQREGKPFFTLTQNQLVDQPYLDYLRKMYGDRLYIPTENDLQHAFTEYVTDAQKRLQAGTLRPGEEVRTVDNRIQVSGQVAVMQINALLAKLIFEKNTDREFYVEESFPLDWMYPYLTPHGLIFELRPKPLPQLSAEAVQKDADYWKRLAGELIGAWVTDETSVKRVCDFADKVYLDKDFAGFKGDAGFAKNEDARKCFSKLRASIAGLYVWRLDHARDPNEKTQMQQAAELAFRQAYALCPSLPETVFRYTTLLTNLRRPDEAFLLAKTTLRLDPNNKSFQDLVRTLSKAQ